SWGHPNSTASGRGSVLGRDVTGPQATGAQSARRERWRCFLMKGLGPCLPCKGATTMTKRTATLMLSALCFCGASGALALGIDWATPPIGVVSTTISGPVEFGPIHLWSRTPTHLVRIQAEGLSDVYVTDVKIAPGGQTGWHAHPGPAFVSVKSGVATEYQADDGDCTRLIHPPAP